MTDESRSHAADPFHRRDFLLTTLAAGAVLPQVFGRRLAAAETGRAAAPRHPLDTLSAAEMAEAVKLLRESRKLADTYRFVSCTLDEPPRAVVLGHKAGEAFPRRAFLVLLDNATGIGYEAVVDLAGKAVARFDPLPKGIQPSIMGDECSECEEAVRRSPEFRAVLEKRGITNPDLVMVEAWSAGNYGNEPAEEKDRRLLRALCFVRSDPKDNGYAHPLDGVVVVFDLNTMKVVRIEDSGVVPVPPEAANWTREHVSKFRGGLKPLEVVQRDGPSFTVDGREVRWQNWRFRIGYTPREGLVLHTVRYRDQDAERPVLYRASVCELLVPYGDPGEKYYRKNAFDVGEYGIGTLADSLSLGCDCLGTVRYFDADFLNSRGKVVTVKNAVCLHEEDRGILWKHVDTRTRQSEVRRSRRLSVSFIANVGNYDYAFYWHFYQDGSLQCEVLLTGVVDATALVRGKKSPYGVEVAPGVNAPLHQHVFVARIDPWIDGEKNSVYEVDTVSLPRGDANPHGNAMRAEATLLATEKQAMRSTNAATSRFWRIVNPGRKNRLGEPVGYRLVPGDNGPTLLRPEAAVMRRAGFAAHQFWVTPYRPEERYPAGDYPTQHPGGDGLPRWTAADRPVVDTDVVLWYVFAHTHVPRPEDWPVMPACSIGFHLKPDGFFARNPALDLPPPA